MDEIEIVKMIKKLIKVFLKLLLPILIIGFLRIMLNENIILNFIFYNLIDIEFSIIVLVFFMFLYNFIQKNRSFIKAKKNIAQNKEYIRDIEIKYSPAIISLILDLQISSFKDYTATILYLCYRKYLEIYKENDEVKFRIIEENTQDLNPHEQYVYRCIEGSGFDDRKFKELIIEDARNLQLISIKAGEIQRTPKGEKEANLWKGFKNYIHDYTLISEKEIEHMVILNEYVPYAIALDEAKSIEKFIAEDENYRNLIYRFYNGEKGKY